MTCYLPTTGDFAKQISINGKLLTCHSLEGHPHYKKIKDGKLTISCYSLSAQQKKVAVTLCALAILASLTAASVLGGMRLVNPAVACAIGTTGLGFSSLVIATLLIKHLLFVRDVSKYLQQQKIEEWSAVSHYPRLQDEECNTMRGDGVFSFPSGNNRYFGKRHVKIWFDTYFCVEFHRTQTIHLERLEKL